MGVAARMATGMGLHTAEVYQSLAVDVAEQQKRIFFSLYMMDRYVQGDRSLRKVHWVE